MRDRNHFYDQITARKGGVTIRSITARKGGVLSNDKSGNLGACEGVPGVPRGSGATTPRRLLLLIFRGELRGFGSGKA